MSRGDAYWQDRRAEQPGRLAAEGTPDGYVRTTPEPGTLRLTNRDAATYLLAVGVTLLEMQPMVFGRGYLFVLDDEDGHATAGMNRWSGRGDRPMVDGRDYADAGALMRRLIRDGMTGPVRFTGGSYREHGRYSA